MEKPGAVRWLNAWLDRLIARHVPEGEPSTSILDRLDGRVDAVDVPAQRRGEG